MVVSCSDVGKSTCTLDVSAYSPCDIVGNYLVDYNSLNVGLTIFGTVSVAMHHMRYNVILSSDASSFLPSSL